MFKRIVLAAALLVAPLALTPMSVDAQERGQETAAASAESGLTTSEANGRSTTLPRGLENRPGEELPPGIMMTRDGAAAEETTDDSGDSGDGCVVTGFDPITGDPIFDCSGT